ncbi:MAG TPA: DUF1611 domain-containing protein [Polyangia bacterium]|nr:DUF1611 domain-containing protein [Polyangia bacterium]
MTDGHLDVFVAKTAVSLLRYCADEVVAVLDAQHAGADLASIVDVQTHVPIVDSVAAALPLQPDHLVIGVANPGGILPPAWRATIIEALANGMDVINGLHTLLTDDEELVRCAADHGRRIHDLRRVTRTYPIGSGKAAGTRARRILTVGTDCNVGKMLASIELARDLTSRGHAARFVATGQTGVLVAGHGEVIDAVKSDFVSGAVETLVLEADEEGVEFIVVEGQGAMLHPGFSGVTLGLMHGVLPDRMILCHQPSRQFMRHTRIPVPALDESIALHQQLLAPIHASRVVAVALNCVGMSPQQIRESIDQTQRATGGMPAADCARTGVEPLTDALLESLA